MRGIELRIVSRTMSALLHIACHDCGHPTQTTMAWLADHGLICEGCNRSVPLNAAELGWGLSMIESFFAEIDDTILILKRPLAGSIAAAV